ncbi:hypothetical protein [Azospirillum agricola]|uniref:hypothetical protein n=1 Tax=Azospirillum agricola TaxID=1720247 RepID=UPI000A0F1443|nr:hypothetical protein [Azospirillum agricola]SMH60426.1 hypothetical protein SAMN02982994_5494 [Azospirillum lipoferum]
MKSLKGATVLVLEHNAILRLGVEALIESWEAEVVSGDNFDDILKIVEEAHLRPSVMLLPPTDRQVTADRLARRLETDLGYRVPWIGITADFSLLQRWQAGEFGGTLLEMPCSPETLHAALLDALRKE